MNIGHIIHYATLLSILMGGLGVVVAVSNHRVQVKTQIFLAMSARYDELLKNSSPEFWLSLPGAAELPPRTDDLHHLDAPFCSATFRNLLFVREWEYLRTEFESFPEFVSLVSSVHRMSPSILVAPK